MLADPTPGRVAEERATPLRPHEWLAISIVAVTLGGLTLAGIVADPWFVARVSLFVMLLAGWAWAVITVVAIVGTRLERRAERREAERANARLRAALTDQGKER